MSPEQSAPTGIVWEKPHKGCNCGRRVAKPVTPLLTADLVIAARDRAREPELPEATLAKALAAPVRPRLARYDVIVIAGSPDHAELETRIAAEFARHDHRVFHFTNGDITDRRPVAPALRRIALPSSAPGAEIHFTETLRALRRTEGIEAAVVFAPDSLDPTVASELRRLWGWRLAIAADAPDSLQGVADVIVHFDTLNGRGVPPGEVALQTGLSWPARWAELDCAFRASWPRASLVVVTHDNLAYNRMCLASILENTDYPNFEVIVVDNGSTDGTVDEIQRLARAVPNLRVMLNEHNAGLPTAYN